MIHYTPSGITLKCFVKERGNEPEVKKPENVYKYMPVLPLTGNKAKEFYEGLVNESSHTEEKVSSASVTPSVKSKLKPNFLQKSNANFKNSDLLWMAQRNDVKSLNTFFSQNQDFDVNIVDDFGWTPLMCASCNGAVDAVKILLENSADPYKCDKIGNTAFKLAKRKNFVEILNMLESYNKNKVSDEINEKEENNQDPFFCSVCKQNFTISKKKHESSTLHLFNCKIKTPTFYGIPESNKGFQLLLKKGWNKERGLGPDGAGRKFPIKPVMKKDRTGIGASVLHNTNKIRTPNSEKQENKKIRSYRKWKDKDFEKNFRLEFS